jgi:hypothetical protein
VTKFWKCWAVFNWVRIVFCHLEQYLGYPWPWRQMNREDSVSAIPWRNKRNHVLSNHVFLQASLVLVLFIANINRCCKAYCNTRITLNAHNMIFLALCQICGPTILRKLHILMRYATFHMRLFCIMSNFWENK